MASSPRVERLNRTATAPAAVARPARWRQGLLDWGLNVLLLIGGVLMIVPFLWAFSTSLRLSRESFTLPPQWLPTDWEFSNYQAVLDALPFFTFIFNSFKVAGLIIAAGKFHGVIAAHTPIGSLVTTMRRSAQGEANISPATRLASSANHSMKDAA